jgi:DNA-binding NarL/FixJ family response regulator
MKSILAKRPFVHVAVVESDPLRFAGFRALLGSEPGVRLTGVSSSEIDATPDVDVVLIGGRGGQNVLLQVEALKAIRSGLRILVTGSGIGDDAVLNALECGAKGYIDEASPGQDLVKAIRSVAQGLIWAPRHVFAMLIDRCSDTFHSALIKCPSFTSREKEVLGLLVEGKSNREIGRSLAIAERSVKAHVAKLMRKAGVQNRVKLSIHAITHSLVSAT